MRGGSAQNTLFKKLNKLIALEIRRCSKNKMIR